MTFRSAVRSRHQNFPSKSDAREAARGRPPALSVSADIGSTPRGAFRAGGAPSEALMIHPPEFLRRGRSDAAARSTDPFAGHSMARASDRLSDPSPLRRGARMRPTTRSAAGTAPTILSEENTEKKMRPMGRIGSREDPASAIRLSAATPSADEQSPPRVADAQPDGAAAGRSLRRLAQSLSIRNRVGRHSGAGVLIEAPIAQRPALIRRHNFPGSNLARFLR